MNFETLIPDLINILPELIMILGIIISVLCACFKNKHQTVFYISAFSLLIPFCLQLVLGKNTLLYSFSGSIQIDQFSLFFTLMILFTSIISLFVSQKMIFEKSGYKSEFFIFLLSATLGATFLAKSTDLISIFVSLELLSISSYFMISFPNGKNSNIEGVLKYFIFSSVTSSFLLYGFSLLYGLTQKTNLTEIYQILVNQNASFTPLTFLAFLMIFVAVGFKTSLFPFHMWTSDVYKGTMPSVNIFLSVASKFGVFSLLLKFIPLHPICIYLIYFISIITIIIGSILAIRENEIKKIMAYSTIAQAGFILSGLCIFNNGYNLHPMFYYMFVYMFMNTGIWICIENIPKNDLTLNDIKGLFYVNPFIGICFSVLLIALAGFPVSAGFFAKFYLLKSILFSGNFFTILFLFVLLSTVLGVFYYVKIIKTIFLKPINRKLLNIKFNNYNLKVLLLLCVIVIIFGGIYPDILNNFVLDYSNILSLTSLN